MAEMYKRTSGAVFALFMMRKKCHSTLILENLWIQAVALHAMWKGWAEPVNTLKRHSLRCFTTGVSNLGTLDVQSTHEHDFQQKGVTHRKFVRNVTHRRILEHSLEHSTGSTRTVHIVWHIHHHVGVRSYQLPSAGMRLEAHCTHCHRPRL